jgi:hypothetical protein
MPPRQGVQVFSAKVSLMGYLHHGKETLVAASSAINLAEHDIKRADDRRDVGQHVPAAQEIHGLQVGCSVQSSHGTI